MEGLAPEYPLRTERLLLRQFEPGDFDALLDIHSRTEVAERLYYPPRAPEDVRRILVHKMHPKPHALDLAAVLAETGALIGDVCLLRIRPEHRQGEIGYVIHPDHAGNGYATEASRALLRLAFEDLRLHRVIGRAQADHRASVSVLEKLGMRHEATFREDEWVKGAWSSQVVYALLEREWLGSD